MTDTMMRDLFVDVLNRYDEAYGSYAVMNEKTVKVTFEGDNLSEIDCMVSFSVLSSGTMMVVINNFDLPNFEGNLAAGVLACNEASNEGMVSYYVDEDNDAVAEFTLMYNSFRIPSQFSPEQVLGSVISLAMDVDDAYPIFGKAKWSN